MMKKLGLSLLITLFIQTFVNAQQEKAFQIFDSKGKKVKVKKLFKNLDDLDVVYFGEYHDNPIAHWLQVELTNKMVEDYGENLVLAFEMFERDQQLLINDFLKDKIKERKFEEEMRMWPNYKTDYRPLVMIAKEHNLPVIASNIPRVYASQLYKRGRESLDSLSENEKSFICPLDFEVDTTLSQYQDIMEMMNHGSGLRMVEAQAIKDATMAESIDRYGKGKCVIHYNGCFHSDFDQGIIWYSKRLKPDLKYLTISTVEQDDVSKLEEEYLGKAEYIICVPSTMTKTH